MKMDFSKIKTWLMQFVNVNIPLSAFDQEKFLGDRQNALEIYDQEPNNALYSPFDMEFLHLEKLMVCNILDDPYYIGIELQTVQSEQEQGAMVLLWPRDASRKVEQYYTPGIDVQKRSTPDEMSILGQGVEFIERDITYSIALKNGGLQAHVEIVDRLGREIKLTIDENPDHANAPFGLVAPVASSSLEPKFMALYYMGEGNMVSVGEQTTIDVCIGKEKRPAELFPVKMNGRRVYFTRYAMKMVDPKWCPNLEGPRAAIVVKGDIGEQNGSTYSLIKNGPYNEIRKMEGIEGDKRAAFTFSPAVPDIARLKDKASLEGRFAYEANGVKGIMGGEYRIQRTGDSVAVTLQPTKGWQPPLKELKKLWFATYQCNIEFRFGEVCTLKRKWERVL